MTGSSIIKSTSGISPVIEESSPLPPQMKVNPASVFGTLNTTVWAERTTSILLDEEIEPASTPTSIFSVPSPDGRKEFDWSVPPTYSSPPIMTLTDALICTPPAFSTE